MPRSETKTTPTWRGGEAYEEYMGRWSRLVAREFIPWLSVPPKKRWLDVGCGTGALTKAILELASPQIVEGIDGSAEYIDYARDLIQDVRAGFRAIEIEAILSWKEAYDAVVSGLVLNFIAPPESALDSMIHVANADGTIGAYVWDYAGKMEFLRLFWDAAIELDKNAVDLDEGKLCSLCEPEALRRIFLKAGIRNIDIRPIDIKTHFKNFEEFWVPFRTGVGPAPIYVMSLSESHRDALREHLRTKLPTGGNGEIELMARAWAVKGLK